MLRDLAFQDYAPAYAIALREQNKAVARALIGIRESLIKKRLDLPQSLEDALAGLQKVLGD
jgi:hypothetical protein